MSFPYLFVIGIGFLSPLLSAQAQAQIKTQDSGLPSEEATELSSVKVFGTGTETLSQPLAPRKISKEKIQKEQLTDVGRALKQTSGVYVREEDGQGLRPNIGLRGTNPDRSKKVVLLEDGILIGPAPYSAPAAYYAPSMNMIESLEILKGFQATGIGPNSVGGAIDYRTPAIPDRQQTELRLSGGSFGTWNNRIRTGGPTAFGGYLIQGSRWSSNGFKELDGGGNTGFTKNDLLSKFRLDLPGIEGRIHNLELRLGYSDEVSNETYLGLTEADFEKSPNRRYRASALDEMKWQHQKLQLHHNLQLTDESLLETALYEHRFHRAWYRLDRFRDNTVNLRDILNNPTGANQNFYDILTGEQDSSTLGTNGELVVANNDRTYLSRGLQTQFSHDVSTEQLEIKSHFAARYHRDQIERHHTSDRYAMTGGQLVRTTAPTQTDTLNQESAEAITLTADTNLTYESWTLTPVARYETVNFELTDKLDPNKNLKRSDRVFVPGLSLLKKWNPSFSTRISRNEAVTLAGLSSTGTEVKEEATNHELEFKYANEEQQLEADLTLFQMDYRNITGTCTVSTGCTNALLDTSFNGGKAKVSGAELGAGQGFQLGSVYVPVQGQLTLLDATFESEFTSQSPEWGTGQVQPGFLLPYIPKTQYSLSVGTQWRQWQQELTLIYQSQVYDQSVDAGRREIPGYGIVDWSGQYNFSKNAKLLAKVDNVLKKDYAVSARPFGLRPGKPQAFHLALDWTF